MLYRNSTCGQRCKGAGWPSHAHTADEQQPPQAQRSSNKARLPAAGDTAAALQPVVDHLMLGEGSTGGVHVHAMWLSREEMRYMTSPNAQLQSQLQTKLLLLLHV